MAIFVNISNHPTSKWDKTQLTAAKTFGEVVDLQFPNVPATATAAEVANIADSVIEAVASYGTETTCMVQGEMTLVYSLVRRLQSLGIKCLAGCTERKTVERQLPDGTTEKTSVFEFAGFREYEVF